MRKAEAATLPAALKAAAVRPRARWISMGGDSERDLPDHELEVIVDALQAQEATQEREAVIAAGEDVTGLDDTDFLIRGIRRDRASAATSLRTLCFRATPYPEVHYQPCACSRCATSETNPTEANRRYDARAKARRARYRPDGGVVHVMTVIDLRKRLERVEAGRQTGAPDRIFSTRPLEDGEAASLFADWRAVVASGEASLTGSVLYIRAPELTAEAWAARHVAPH